MKNLKVLHLTLAAGVVALAATTAAAQSTATTPSTAGPGQTASGPRTTTATTASTDTKSKDSRFLKKAADGGMSEVEMGRLGVDKAASSEVKQFAQKMVDDHSKANTELTSLASSKSVDVAADTSKTHKMDSKLADKAGADFDVAYMKMMVSDHKKDVRDFEREAKNGKDPEVKAWAEKTLPTLRQHLQEAQSIYDGLKGTSKTTTSRSTTKTSS